MFPIVAFGFSGASALSDSAPNASTAGALTATAATASNLSNAYTPGQIPPYAQLSAIGCTALSGPSWVEANYQHSPTSGLVANSLLTMTVDLSAIFNVTGLVRGASNYVNVRLRVLTSGTYSDTTSAHASPLPAIPLTAIGQDAFNALNSGGSYTVSYNGTLSVTIGPFTGKTLDIYNVVNLIQIEFDPGTSNGTADVGTISGNFTCNIQNIKYFYS